jgi:hypothetical protein
MILIEEKEKKQMLLNKENYKLKLQLKLKTYLEDKPHNSKKLLIKIEDQQQAIEREVRRKWRPGWR